MTGPEAALAGSYLVRAAIAGHNKMWDSRSPYPLQPPPRSAIVAFFLGTRYLRILGQRLFPVYEAKLPGGANMHLRSRYGFDAATVGEVIYKRVYERFFSPGRGETVVDVGAHIGSFTLIAASEVGPDGSVLSLEPSTRNFKMLARNIASNHLNNVRALNVAAGSAEGQAELALYSRAGGNSFYPRKLNRLGSEAVKVKTLDSVVSEFGLSRVDFVKIDVEGHELEVLRGASETLGRHHPKIVMETHDFGPPVEDLTGYLRQYRYSTTAVPYGKRLGLLYAS